MLRYLIISLCCLGYLHLPAQDFSGIWKGNLYQEGKDRSFYFELELKMEGNIITGTSYSRLEGGGGFARFDLTGAWDGKEMALQELAQLAPEEPKWCLKYMTMTLSETDQEMKLTGKWKSEGCIPGTVRLTKAKTVIAPNLSVESTPFSANGHWTGFVSQSDREYGFYYEVDLDQATKGWSYIVSEASGGSADHELEWSYDPGSKELTLKEYRVNSRTDSKWKWCIKSARLQLGRKENAFTLEGYWEGYIEGFTLETGPCAAGKMYLEKVIPKQEITEARKENSSPYERETNRKVKIERVIEVNSPNLRIKLWDNGTVDGDVASIFLNGKKLIQNYRVTKTKRGLIANLEEGLNFLILHAEDLGTIKPNTVAVSIDDGKREQILILSSNLRESGAVLIKQFQYK